MAKKEPKLIPKSKIVDGRRVFINPPPQVATPNTTRQNAIAAATAATTKAQQIGVNTPTGQSLLAQAKSLLTNAQGTQQMAQQSPFEEMIKGNALLSDKLKNNPELSQWFYGQDETTQGMFVQMYGELEKSIESGKVVNPAIKITPRKLKEFMNSATSQLDPYYQEQYSTLKTDIDTAISRLDEDYTKGIERAQEPFAQSLKDQAQAESEAGTVYSSERARREQAAVTDQTNKLEDFNTLAQRNVTDLLGNYEQLAGSQKARQINLPTIPGYQATNAGTFSPTASRSISAPYGGIELGSLGRERGTAVKTRAQELEEIYRSGQVLSRNPL